MHQAAAAAVAPGGVLLVLAHDRSNLAEGVGGPQDPAILPTPEQVAADLADTGLTIERAEIVLRPVDGAPRPARDCLVLATRPSPGPTGPTGPTAPTVPTVPKGA